MTTELKVNNKDKENNVNVFDELQKEVTEEIKRDNEFLKANYKDVIAKRETIFNRVFEKMFGKLLTKIQVKITVSWNGKELFTYVIPKN